MFGIEKAGAAEETLPPVRIGAVSYLNTKPLVYDLERLAPWARLVLDVPSRLADGLAAGRLDVALIPSVAYVTGTRYQVVSDACIACRGPVWSVRLLSRVPMRQIGVLALDEGSRTSVVLVQLLLWRRFGLRPRLIPLPLGSAPQDVTADAVLVIGDRAIHESNDGFHEVWDLGEEWWEETGLPFVFAMWVARPGLVAGPVAQALSAARDAGVAALPAIALQEAPRLNVPWEACLRYLRDHLHFYMGSEERRGLDLFFRWAAELRLLEAPVGVNSSLSRLAT